MKAFKGLNEISLEAGDYKLGAFRRSGAMLTKLTALFENQNSPAIKKSRQLAGSYIEV
jgi:hypothetical protein